MGADVRPVLVPDFDYDSTESMVSGNCAPSTHGQASARTFGAAPVSLLGSTSLDNWAWARNSAKRWRLYKLEVSGFSFRHVQVFGALF